jgi:PAS domain S-box-containing protein
MEPPRFTARVIKDDGQVAYIQSWTMPIRADDGAVTGFFGTTQDVTERKRGEALIEESLANLERAERLALLGHYKIERDTGKLTWSSGVFRIFGLSPENFAPTLRGVLELMHPDDRHLLKQFRDEAMAGKEIPHATLRALRSDGEIVDIEYWSTPVRDRDGAITGVFGTMQDVTLRKRAENALALANHELEARVNERTAELAEEMRRREEAQMTLGQMQKMEAVGQLTAGIAHDFNNLLAVIGGSLEFVDQAAAHGLTAEPELIDAALRATRRGAELVRRLLAFSRQSPLRAESTPINQLVLDTLRLLQRTLGQGIDMVTRLDAEAAVISVDRNQMANALLNLALNARDAMPDGGQLTIATCCQASPPKAAGGAGRRPQGEDVCIVISDTGSGMTEEVRKRAFEPFFTTKPDGLGSGLGLSMVQGFVEQSGGQIEIESEPGRGTTITIRLPRIAAVGQTEDSDRAVNSPGNGRDKTVLLVEDDPDVRVVTAAQLKSLGYRVHAVANGMEAIDLIASPANIDITLTDIVLPGGLDGVELIKEAMRARPNMGVLCMSGYDPTRKHRKWLQVQNINFLQKPFSSSRLAQALDAALAH